MVVKVDDSGVKNATDGGREGQKQQQTSSAAASEAAAEGCRPPGGPSSKLTETGHVSKQQSLFLVNVRKLFPVCDVGVLSHPDIKIQLRLKPHSGGEGL